MNGNITNSTNLKLRSKNDNISTIFSSNYAGISMSAPTNFAGLDNPASLIYVANGGTVPNDRNFVCDIPFTGTDTETGYGPPTGSPMYATGLYGAYVIDYYNGFATSNMAGVSAICPITFKDVTIEGQATKALSIKFLAVADATYNHATHTAGYRQQAWGNIRRSLSSGTDFESFGFNCFVWVNNLSDKFSTAKRRATIVDMKNGHSTLGGALRHVLTIISANSADSSEFGPGVPVGTLGWEVIIDNNANYTDGLTPEEFIRYTTYTVPVPQEQWFELDFAFKKSASYSDLTTGRFTIKIRLQNTTEWLTIADLYSTTVAQYEIAHPLQCLFPTAGAPHAQRNIHHSVRTPDGASDDRLQRIFFGQYSNRLNTDFEIMFAKPRFYGGIRDL